MKVLVVEDDSDQLALRCMLLRRAGFNPLQAKTVESALELAKNERPSCAVVDLRLPTESRGLNLIRELREGDAGMKLIVLTGAQKQWFSERPESKMVDDVFTKPVASSALIEKLRAASESVRCG